MKTPLKNITFCNIEISFSLLTPDFSPGYMKASRGYSAFMLVR